MKRTFHFLVGFLVLMSTFSFTLKSAFANDDEKHVRALLIEAGVPSSDEILIDEMTTTLLSMSNFIGFLTTDLQAARKTVQIFLKAEAKWAMNHVDCPLVKLSSLAEVEKISARDGWVPKEFSNELTAITVERVTAAFKRDPSVFNHLSSVVLRQYLSDLKMNSHMHIAQWKLWYHLSPSNELVSGVMKDYLKFWLEYPEYYQENLFAVAKENEFKFKDAWDAGNSKRSFISDLYSGIADLSLPERAKFVNAIKSFSLVDRISARMGLRKHEPDVMTDFTLKLNDPLVKDLRDFIESQMASETTAVRIIPSAFAWFIKIDPLAAKPFIGRYFRAVILPNLNSITYQFVEWTSGIPAPVKEILTAVMTSDDVANKEFLFSFVSSASFASTKVGIISDFVAGFAPQGSPARARSDFFKTKKAEPLIIYLSFLAKDPKELAAHLMIEEVLVSETLKFELANLFPDNEIRAKVMKAFVSSEKLVIGQMRQSSEILPLMQVYENVLKESASMDQGFSFAEVKQAIENHLALYSNLASYYVAPVNEESYQKNLRTNTLSALKNQQGSFLRWFDSKGLAWNEKDLSYTRSMVADFHDKLGNPLLPFDICNRALDGEDLN